VPSLFRFSFPVVGVECTGILLTTPIALVPITRQRGEHDIDGQRHHEDEGKIRHLESISREASYSPFE
jgi:hypothetical protein